MPFVYGAAALIALYLANDSISKVNDGLTRVGNSGYTHGIIVAGAAVVAIYAVNRVKK